MYTDVARSLKEENDCKKSDKLLLLYKVTRIGLSFSSKLDIILRTSNRNNFLFHFILFLLDKKGIKWNNLYKYKPTFNVVLFVFKLKYINFTIK